MNVSRDGGLCLWHDPSRADQAKAARSRGASTANAKRSPVRTVEPSETPGPLESIEDAARWASWIVMATSTGRVDARTSHELVFALRLFVDSKKHIDRSDERIRELTRKLAALRDGARR